MEVCLIETEVRDIKSESEDIQMPKGIEIRLVRDLGKEYSFLDISQEMEFLQSYILSSDFDKYDTFFVKLGDDGDYDEVWGMYGIVPRMDNTVYRLR